MTVQHIPAINRALTGTGWTAKRSRVKPNEVIVGMGGDIEKCITVILADNPSDDGRPTWYVGIFSSTSPRDLSNSYEVQENPVLVTAVYWNSMLALVRQAIA